MTHFYLLFAQRLLIVYICHQADILFLPSDRGYKYLLVVVDISTRLIDAEQLKDKNASSVVKGFKKIIIVIF